MLETKVTSTTKVTCSPEAELRISASSASNTRVYCENWCQLVASASRLSMLVVSVLMWARSAVVTSLLVTWL